VGVEPVLFAVLERRLAEVADHLVGGVLSDWHPAERGHGDLAGQVTLGHRGGDVGDRADLRGEIGRELIDVVGEVLPRAGGAGHARLATELALDADLTRDRRDLVGEGGQGVDHRVDRVGELGDLPLGLEGELAAEVAVGDGGHDARDTAHLAREVTRHRVDVVGEVLPGAGHVLDVGLTAELALGADLAGDARHLRRQGAELVGHGVDGVLELEDLAADVDVELSGEVAVGDGGGNLGDVPDLRGQVAGHRVDGVAEVLPGAGHATYVGLAAELALGADLAGDARHLRGERADLIDHRVDGVLELQDLAAAIHRYLLGQVTIGDGGGDLGDVADLRGEVAGHRVDGIGEVLPGAGHVADVGLAAELALGADLAGDARDFGGARAELVDHRVDGVLELEHLSSAVDGELQR